jgi:hypothetical protein
MGEILCGHPEGDGHVCILPAAIEHSHNREQDGFPYPEMSQVIADEAALLNQADQMVPARGVAEALGITASEAAANMAVVAQELTDADVKYLTRLGRPPRTDFRAMLGDDTQAWATRTRLAETLGRPYLATALADQLNPETSAALADRLQSLVSQARSETEMKINADVARATHETITNIRTALDLKRDELHKKVSRERFGRGSRLD